ncbi:MAG: amidohydrolase family protein [Gemmatimonadales bacterium]
MTRYALLLAGLAVSACQPARDPSSSRQPIIDMHLHAFGADWVEFFKDTSWFPPGRATDSDSLREHTLRMLEELNIVKAVASGVDQAIIDRWHAAAPDRIIPALVLTLATPLDTIRSRVKTGAIRVLGEAIWQYQGVAPNDRRLEPFWALAEELDLPIGIHVGPGPPAIQREMPFRNRLGDPLPLEEVLALHPRLRLWVMHAGWPMDDHMVGLLHSFPQVYVDVSLINGMFPRAEFHAYLRRLTEAGYGQRIMYGSDQALWPGRVSSTVEAIESAEFLSPAQKRDILCANAARFLRLELTLCDP